MSSAIMCFFNFTNSFTVFLILISAPGCIAVDGDEAQILTSTEDFVISNGTASIEFTIQGAETDTIVSISKKRSCPGACEDQIFIRESLTPGAREGITVHMENVAAGHTYQVDFVDANDADVGIYIVNVFRPSRGRYELLTSRALPLVKSRDEDVSGGKDSPICEDQGALCSNTGWIAAFSVVFVTLLFIICINMFFCIKLWPHINEMFKPGSKTEEEDIYVLRNVGSDVAHQEEKVNKGNEPTDDYEDMDELVKSKRSAGLDQKDTGDNVSRSSVPGDEPLSLPSKVAGDTSEYDMPETDDAEDPEFNVPDVSSHHFDVAPTLPKRPASAMESTRLPPVSETELENVIIGSSLPTPRSSKPAIPPKTRPKSAVALNRSSSNLPEGMTGVSVRGPMRSHSSTSLEPDVIVTDLYDYERIGSFGKHSYVTP